MAPAFLPGDRVLAVPVWRLRPGDVVVVDDGTRRMVKRVTSLSRSTVSVAGDTSGRYGPLPRSAVLGRVVYRYGPPGRVQRIGSA